MTNKIRLEFLPNEADEDEGVGHSGIETYTNDPYSAVARETGQNSRDAAEELPVRIHYDVLEVARSEIPAIESLAESIALCFQQSVGKKKETDFFSVAERTVKSSKIKILRISDFKTSGARGPAKKGNPFHSLVKGSGVSIKGSEHSGGSFGIGKNAAFALSELQTVFYSTVYDSNGTPKFLAQGKSVLISHNSADGVAKRQTGYWGREKFREVDETDEVPGWLARHEKGTSVFALGFKSTENWAYRIAISLIQNFFLAIQSNEMQFSLDQGSIEIGSATLPALFKDARIIQAAELNENRDELIFAEQLYECLISQNSKNEIVDVPTIGRVSVRILVQEGLPKKIVIARNGMVITDNLSNFGDAFAKFPRYKDFVALVTPLDNGGSEFIKRLEDSQHRTLSAERLPDERQRSDAKAIMKKFGVKIRDAIKSHTLTKFESEVSADEMRQFFSGNYARSENSNASPNDDPERIKYSVQNSPSRRASSGAAPGGGNSGRPRPGSRNTPRGSRQLPPRGGGGTSAGRPVEISDVRNIRPLDGNIRSRKIFFTPREGGMATISLRALGLREAVELGIQSADGIDAVNGALRRVLVANERVQLDVILRDNYDGPIEVQVGFEAASGD